MMTLGAQLQKQHERFTATGKKDLAMRQANKSIPEGISAPNGDVAIVFSDIEDSFTLWETIPEIMLITIETYNRILRDKLKENRGYEVIFLNRNITSIR